MKMNRTQGTRWWLTRIFLVLALLVVAMTPATTVPKVHAAVGGPIVLMGIDAEDGGIGEHGPISVYRKIATNILSKVTNGGSGILLIGGNSGSQVTTWWEAVVQGVTPTQTLTHVNSADITTQSFAGFAIVAIASSQHSTDGGLSDDESARLNARADDIATHVNNGGGL